VPSGSWSVGVKGLTEFRKSLRTIDKDLGKGLRKALNTASDFIIGQARPLIPRKTGKAAKSLKARSSQEAVRIVVGGKAAPYYPWLDYGGNVGKDNSAHRPFISEGRYLYPTLGKHRAEFERLLQGALTDVARGAGIDVD